MALIAGANGANVFSTSNMYTSLVVNGCQRFSCVTYSSCGCSYSFNIKGLERLFFVLYSPLLSVQRVGQALPNSES